MTDRAAFLAERRKSVGGSDIAAIYSIEYSCRRRLFYEKRDTPPDFPREETKAMRLGTFMEEFFAEEYARETGRGLRKLAVPLHSDDSGVLRVNVDRVVSKDQEPPSRSSDFGVLEIKSMGREMYYRTKREGLSQSYILQLQAGMIAANSTWGSFAVGSRDSGNLIHFDVDRDDKLCKSIVEDAEEFWKLVENGPIPDALEPGDRRCQSCEFRVTCQGNALVELAPESDYTPDESLRPLVSEFIERRALRKEAEDLFADAKSELESALGERTMIMAGGAKIQFYEFTKKEYVVKAHIERPLKVYEGKK